MACAFPAGRKGHRCPPTENSCHSKHLAPLYLSCGEVWLRHTHTYKPPGPKQQKSKAWQPLCCAPDRLINYTQNRLKKEYFLFPASRIGKASSGRNRYVVNIQNTKEGGARSPTLPGLSNLGQQLEKNNPPFENVQWCQAQDLVRKFLPYFRRIPVKIWPGDRRARAFCGRGWGRNEGQIVTYRWGGRRRTRNAAGPWAPSRSLIFPL